MVVKVYFVLIFCSRVWLLLSMLVEGRFCFLWKLCRDVFHGSSYVSHLDRKGALASWNSESDDLYDIGIYPSLNLVPGSLFIVPYSQNPPTNIEDTLKFCVQK